MKHYNPAMKHEIFGVNYDLMASDARLSGSKKKICDFGESKGHNLKNSYPDLAERLCTAHNQRHKL
jgi:hypothetical protein